MTAPSIRDHSYGSLDTVIPTATVMTIDAVAGVTDGDFMLAIIGQGNSGNPESGPSGWVELHANNGNNYYARITTRTASGEPASYDFTIGSNIGTNNMAGVIVAVQGMDGSDPVNASSVATGTAHPAITPSVTTTVDECLVLSIVVSDRASYTSATSAPSGWTLQHVRAGSEDGGAAGDTVSIAVAYKEQAVAGEVAAADWGIGDISDDWFGATIAIAPAASGGGGGGAAQPIFLFLC